LFYSDFLSAQITREPKIDGVGGGTSSTSKVMLVWASERPDCDLDYRFGHVAIDSPVIDWSGNCGNLTAAVAPFALQRGLVRHNGNPAWVRLWQQNIGKRIDVWVPMDGNLPAVTGDLKVDGVAWTGAPIEMCFFDPAGAGEGGLFPTGRLIDQIPLEDGRNIVATLINAGNPSVFIDAESIGLTAAESQDTLAKREDLANPLETLRARASVMMGLAANEDEATQLRPATPKIAIVSAPKDGEVSGGTRIPVEEVDLVSRIWSMGKPHHAYTGTGAIALAVAASIPGTLVHERARSQREGSICFGHASGKLEVGVMVQRESGIWRVTEVRVLRTARTLMEGVVYVP
jgi:hypothetical protein